MKDIDALSDYYYKYRNYYSPQVIEYSKVVVKSIQSSEDVRKFFLKEEIVVEYFLNELLPLSEYKFQISNNEMLNKMEMDYVFNLLAVSSKIGELIEAKHARAIAIRQSGRLTYELDDIAITVLKEKFEMDIRSHFFSLDDIAMADEDILEDNL